MTSKNPVAQQAKQLPEENMAEMRRKFSRFLLSGGEAKKTVTTITKTETKKRARASDYFNLDRETVSRPAKRQKVVHISETTTEQTVTSITFLSRSATPATIGDVDS